MRKIIIILILTITVYSLNETSIKCYGDSYDTTGTWEYFFKNSQNTGGNTVCPSWNSMRNTDGTILVTQNGNSMVVVDNYNGATYTGTISGTCFTLSGSYSDFGGTVNATINICLTSSTSGNGTITAQWSSGSFFCNYESDMPITKICSYSITPTSKLFSRDGGTGSVSVSTTGSDCSLTADWSATSDASWITITSGSGGNGNGTVNYSVSSYSGTSQRTGTMTIAGQPFTVTQGALDTVHVDFTYTGTESGTQSQPFNTLAEAIDAVAVGGEIIIESGTTSETFEGINKIDKEVTIKSSGGTVTIGKQ